MTFSFFVVSYFQTKSGFRMVEMLDKQKEPTIAVLIPCYNEAATIRKVILDFQHVLPSAKIYVFDNVSTDNSAQIAKETGAIVKTVPYRGKGYVIRKMFREVQADYYILVDGDDTYSAKDVYKFLHYLEKENVDMVVGVRLYEDQKEAFPRFHFFGNWFITKMINKLFSTNFKDVLSGYRGFSNLFVESIQLTSKGFEIEVEMTAKAIESGLTVQEVDISYRSRPENSVSKLRTFKDGFFIVSTIFDLFKNYKPLLFFWTLSFILFLLGLLIGIPVIREYLLMKYVYKVPSAILAASLEVLSFIMFACGIILDAFKDLRLRQQEYWLKYSSRKRFL